MSKFAEMEAAVAKKTGGRVGKEVKAIIEGLDEQVITYHRLSRDVECKDMRAIFTAIKALPLKLQALVVDRETKVPGNGFWKALYGKEPTQEWIEFIDAKHTALVERHTSYELLDADRKTKTRKGIAKDTVDMI